MAERPAYTLDASTAVKWFLRLPDEPYIDFAAVVMRDFMDHRIRLVAPDRIRSELGHAMTRTVRRGRITFDQGRSHLEDFSTLGVELIPHSGVLLGGYQLAQRYGCSCYDATYLALAVMTDTPFLHAEGKLSDRLNGQFTQELWIEDDQSSR